MLTYNTKLKKLILPEYGRHIQKMVDYCLTIDNRDERTDCAYSIVNTMEMLFPAQGDIEEYRRKLWDHLAIMSDFELDIDWPFDVIRQESLSTLPDPMPLPNPYVEYKQYGKLIVEMVRVAADMEDGPDKDALVLLLANQIKKQLLALNPDGVEDEKVFADMAHMTHGAIRLSADTTKLYEFKSLPVPKKKKKK